jgi:RHS repeat-associated protein
VPGNPPGRPPSRSVGLGSNHATTYSYANNFTVLSGGSNVGYTPSGNTDAYLTQITDPLLHIETFTYDFNNGQLTVSKDQNDINASRPGTTYLYNDSLSRPTLINYPDGGQTSYAYNDSAYNGSLTAPTPSVTATTEISSGVNKVTTAAFDGLGHAIETILNSDPAGPTYTSIAYYGTGHPYQVFNPYRTTSDPTYGITTYTYDAIGRTTQIKHPDGTSATTSYAGRATSTLDEGNGTAPVQRITQVDGLGRLTSVCEVTSSTQLGPGGAPAACGQDIAGTGFLTAYGYDVLGNLLTVNQGSLGQRTFAYDSLSRLLCAANPETGTATCPNPGTGSYTTGTTGYTYDANGNLSLRTRPAPNLNPPNPTVTTTYQYDVVNRLTQKSYSDTVPTYTNGTPTVMYGYDQTSITMGSQQFSISNNVGRMSWSAPVSQADYTISMNAFSYDPMGRTAELWQSNPVNSNNIFISYVYDLLGDETNRNLNDNTYAAKYNAIGQLTTFTATDYTDSTNPANLLTGAGYDPFGHLTAATFANGLSQNGLSESSAYDNRGRPKAAAVGTTCSGGTCTGSTVYGYSVSYAGDGDILSATDTVNGQWAYTYDGFNRLLTSCSSNCPVGGSTPGFSYGYDRYGNRWNQTLTAGSGSWPQPSFTFTGAQNGGVPNNRIDSDSYDAAGNLLNDGTNSYTYDAENRIKSVNGATTYTYDAEGRRVAKTTGASVIDFIYDREGHVMLRNSNPASPSSALIEMYVAGLHLGTYVLNSTVTDTIFYYNHADWLGTERARTNLSGTACETIQSLPFGDEQVINRTCGDVSPMHFTGKERDTESSLDNFGARYYASSMGRFMSPDWGGPMPTPDPVPWADLNDPQTLNLYSYVRNNPTSYADEDGHTYHICDEHGQNCSDVSDQQFAQMQQNAQQSGETWKNGNIYLQGEFKGTYNQTDVDLNPNAQNILSSPVLQNAAATMNDPRTYAAWFAASATMGYGLYAAGAFEGGLTTLEIGAEAGEATPSAGQVAQAERVLQQNGKKSVEKALRTLEKRLAEHEEKIRNATGHTSSMEREVENFKQLIQAYKDVLK